MRRTIFLGATLPILMLGMLGWMQAKLLAQAPKTPSSARVPTSSAAPLIAVEAPAIPANLGKAIESSPARQRYLELATKKAQVLSEEQVKNEIETMEREVVELEAWAKANEAVRLLKDLIEKHPNTQASQAAKAAIQVLENRRNMAARSDLPHPDPISLRSRASHPTFKRDITKPRAGL